MFHDKKNMYYDNKTGSMLFYCMCSVNDWFFTESLVPENVLMVSCFRQWLCLSWFSSLWLIELVSLYTIIIYTRAKYACERQSDVGGLQGWRDMDILQARSGKEGVKPFSDSDFCILHKKGKNRHFLLPSQKKNLPLPTINLYSTIYILWIRKLSSLAW